MTALTQNLGSTHTSKYGTIQTYKVGAATHIYRYATVVVRDDGYLYPAEEDISDTLKQIVIGIAQEEINNTGSAGAKSCRVRNDGKVRRAFAGSASQSTIGKLACIQDDQTVQIYQAVGAGHVVMGRVTEVISAAEVYVDIIDRPLRLATDTNN